MIGEVYKRDRSEAQDLSRHKSIETTREAYSHRDAEKQRERLDELLQGID
jgi:integrase